jgi:hypothetical protein
MKTKTQIKMAPRGAGAVGGARQKKSPVKEWYTVVVYEKKKTKTVVLYVGRETFKFKIPAGREVLGVVLKKWRVGNTVAYSMSIHAKNLVKLIDAYAHEEATRKISMFDPIYRAAALAGYKVHDNELYVKLWLTKPLGEPLFHTGDPRERELGDCLKHFTHSYGIWRMVTPPWAARC